MSANTDFWRGTFRISSKNSTKIDDVCFGITQHALWLDKGALFFCDRALYIRKQLQRSLFLHRERLVEGHTLSVNKSDVVHSVEVLVTVGLTQDVVSLHYDDGGEGSDTLELHQLLVGGVVYIDEVHARLGLAKVVEVLLQLLELLLRPRAPSRRDEHQKVNMPGVLHHGCLNLILGREGLDGCPPVLVGTLR